MNQEIEQGNKLIAEFEGWESNKYPNLPNKLHKIEDGEEMGISINNLEYHTSWDWLMPVVEKIEKLGYNTDLIQYHGDSMFIVSEGTPQGDGGKYEKTIIDVTETGFRKIEVTWQAVIQFIQWYNTQTK